MKKILKTLMVLMISLSFQRCAEEGRLDFIYDSGEAPMQVSNITVKNTVGGATLHYKINNDDKLDYVKAVYEIKEGVFKESKSSIYSDSLLLEGFGETKEYKVKVYSVGKNNKASEPVLITVNPLEPAVNLAFEDLTIEAAFGGVKVKLKNELKANLAVVVEADTSGVGVLRPLQTFFTAAEAGSFTIRGLSSKDMKFSVYLRDRWGNKSLAIVRDLVPLYEEFVPKPFVSRQLPNDTKELSSTYRYSHMWDGVASANIYASPNNTRLPQWFTVDLNIPVVLSRMKAHQRVQNFTYSGGCVKQFEIWGSNDPAPDGSWDSWAYIATFDSFKPSGTSVGVLRAEDILYGYTNGEDFEFEETPLAYRFIRFKTTETWGEGANQVTISEISFWGTF